MGRLMDDILAMFGIKPSDRVKFDSPVSRPENVELQPKDFSNIISGKNSTVSSMPAFQEKHLESKIIQNREDENITKWSSFLDQVQKELFHTKTTSPTLTSSSEDPFNKFEHKLSVPVFPVTTKLEHIEEKDVKSKEVSQEVPEEDKDCFGCRAVSVVTCAGVCAFIARQVYTGQKEYHGWRKAVFRMHGAVLMIFFASWGMTAVLKFGMYDPKNMGKSFTELLGQDLTALYSYFGKPTPNIVMEMLEKKNKTTEPRKEH